MPTRGQATWRLSLQAWLSLLALGLVLWLAVTHASLLMEISWVLFGALLLSIAIHPVVTTLARWRIPRVLTVLGLYVLFGVFLALLGSLLAPAIRQEIALLQNSRPDFVQSLVSRAARIPLLSQLLPSTDTLAQSLMQRIDVILKTALSTAVSVGGMALDLLIMLILVFFVSTDASLGVRVLDRWLPAAHQAHVLHVWNRVRRRLTRWVWAQLAIALFFVVTFSTGLALLGVPFAFSIGLVGGALEIIPYLGGAVAVFLAVVSALSVRPLLALWVFILYLVVTELEAHVIAPAFYGRAIGLHPAIVLVALLVGVKAAGILGVLFAVPVAVVFTVLIAEVRVVWQDGTTQPGGQEGISSEADSI